MGKWADLNGQVIVRKDKHLSLKKVIEDFFDGEDFSFEAYKPSLENNESSQDYIYNIDLNIEVDGYMAWKMFSTLQEVLVEKGCQCDLRGSINL